MRNACFSPLCRKPQICFTLFLPDSVISGFHVFLCDCWPCQRKGMQMNKEHTIVNGANRLEGCAKHIHEHFSAQGYKVDVVKSNDTKCNGLFVQVCNMKGAVGSLLKLATGLQVGIILKMWTSGDDLKFHIVGSKWINPTVLATASILPSPFESSGLFGILNPLVMSQSWGWDSCQKSAA